jgi:1,4-alpha-glucan branching enzyme
MGLLHAPGHGGVARLLGDLNRLYRAEPAFFELDKKAEGFQWVDADNAEESVLAFERRDRSGGRVLCAFNFTPVARRGSRIGVEVEGHFAEILNTNAAEYGGTGEGNFGGVRARRLPAHGRPHCIEVALPPLSAVFFRVPS